MAPQITSTPAAIGNKAPSTKKNQRNQRESFSICAKIPSASETKNNIMKLPAPLLISCLALGLLSCKSEKTTEAPEQPAATEQKEAAPLVSEKPIIAEPLAKAPKVITPEAPSPDPILKPTAAKPKKLTLDELAAGINENPKAVVKKMTDLQEELADSIESIVDKETAEVALFDLDSLIGELVTLGQAINTANEDVQTEIRTALQEASPKTQARLQKGMMNAAPVFMSDPSLIEGMRGTMGKLRDAFKAGQ